PILERSLPIDRRWPQVRRGRGRWTRVGYGNEFPRQHLVLATLRLGSRPMALMRTLFDLSIERRSRLFVAAVIGLPWPCIAPQRGARCRLALGRERKTSR